MSVEGGVGGAKSVPDIVTSEGARQVRELPEQVRQSPAAQVRQSPSQVRQSPALEKKLSPVLAKKDEQADIKDESEEKGASGHVDEGIYVSVMFSEAWSSEAKHSSGMMFSDVICSWLTATELLLAL